MENRLDHLTTLTTEQRNHASMHIDTASTEEIVRLMAAEDRCVIEAVERVISQIVRAADVIAAALKKGGRLFYIGSGTSGRLGILDAAELLPTYGVGEDQVKAIIAGGPEAVFIPVERAEDDDEAGRAAIAALHLTEDDVVVGITASGRTPYVLGALRVTREAGATAIALTCNAPSEAEKLAHITIAPIVGPEIVTGSTRMKAGTAQKMVLNMLSTTAMIRLGKVYQNFMVDMIPTNQKLRVRAQHIVSETTGVSQEEARRYLIEAEWNIKAAIVMARARCSLSQALQYLSQGEGVVGRALQIAAAETETE
ncbi:MAG: N-acetylmuramic acid 6-phosphate etherase [Firmicutes bacterium]|nr:N-acetylmuramic acid 6-phosphate etherase [Bacillota bacterium]